METNWHASRPTRGRLGPSAEEPSGASRAWQILVGYNLPLAVWTAWAMFRPTIAVGLWPCPAQATLAWCPGCGLTAAYGQVLRGGGLQDGWLFMVLAGFVANGLWSVYKAAATHGRPRAQAQGLATNEV